MHPLSTIFFIAHYRKRAHILVYFNQDIILIYLFLSTRTKVECGGLCLTHSSCGAFFWDGTTCTVLNKDRLFKDKTTKVDIYVQQPNAAGKYIIHKLNYYKINQN